MREERDVFNTGIRFDPLAVMIVRDDELNPWRYELRHGPPKSPHFRLKFEQAATAAGQLLGTCPAMSTASAYWIDKLFSHCKEHWLDYVATVHQSNSGGSLNRLCEASAAYCAWWDVHIMEVMKQQNSDVDAGTMAILNALEELSLPKALALAGKKKSSPDWAVDSQFASRKEAVDSFIHKILAEEGEKITRKDIWIVAGYQDRSEFQRYQRNDPKATNKAVCLFDETLSLEPKRFLERLRKRRA